MGLDARLVSFAFALSVCFVLFFTAGKIRCSFFSDLEDMGGEKRTNGDVNQVDEEHNRRSSNFLPINPLHISTFRFDFFAMRC